MPAALSREFLSTGSRPDAWTLLASLAATLLEAPLGIVCIREKSGRWTYHPPLRADGLPEADLEAALAATGCWETEYSGAGHPAGIRFMAAAALRGDRRGVLAVLDHEQRRLSGQKRAVLERLADAGAAALSGARIGSPLWLRLDLEGRITACCESTSLAGYRVEELTGRSLFDLIPAEHADDFRQRVLAQLGGAAQAFELPIVHRRGGTALLDIHTQLYFAAGRPAGIEVLYRDITTHDALDRLRHETEHRLEVKARELERLTERLRRLQKLSTTAFESLAELMNAYLETGCELFAVRLGRVLGADDEVVASVPRHAIASFEIFLSSPITVKDEVVGHLEYGSEQSLPPATAQDRDVMELMAQAIGHAISAERYQREHAALNHHLEQQLRLDPLTGLPNRLGLSTSLNAEVAAAAESGQSVVVLFIDLDRFKQVNDTLGHSAGDELLRQVGARLAGCRRSGDFIARTGGDEFTFVLGGDLSDDAIADYVRQILERVRAPYVVNDYELFLTASVGISVCPRDGFDPEVLLQRADAAMYRAKSHGKNDFQFFTPDMVTRTMSRLELENQLRRAIEHGELEIRFQPILNIDSSLESLEVLLAWENPKLGRIGPSRFIPIAEESGMIVAIGRWVLQQSCMQNMSWLASGYPLQRISVNVSALQFARTDFVEMVAGVLQETGMPPQCLELELTEGLIMRDVEESSRRMEQLRELGVSMSIDDFGTGYSSLSYLRRLPVDSLKIDRSFLSEMSSSTSSLPLIQTIVVLAHNMGLSVVAEGVETEEQLTLLRAIGCDRVQGHLFGEPLPSVAVPHLFRKLRTG